MRKGCTQRLQRADFADGHLRDALGQTFRHMYVARLQDVHQTWHHTDVAHSQVVRQTYDVASPILQDHQIIACFVAEKIQSQDRQMDAHCRAS